MTILQVADLSFGYGADKLFESVTFSLALGERVSLVAPNGAGKSTLLRLIAQRAHARPGDGGRAPRRRASATTGSRTSSPPRAPCSTRSCPAFTRWSRCGTRSTRRSTRPRAAAKRDLDRLARATDRYHLARGDELERKVEMHRRQARLSRRRHGSRPVASLSGGERGRLHLGVVLAQEPDLLLLDEPTNHLDLDTIAWLESTSSAYRGAVLVVSHDRAFLDAVTRGTMELGRTSFRVYPLAYSDYAVAREEDLARERELAERQQAFVDKTEDFIRKNIAGQKTKQAQSRRKMLDKLDRLERPEDVWAVAEKVRFRFAPAPRTGDIVLDAKGLGASRGGRLLFDGRRSAGAARRAHRHRRAERRRQDRRCCKLLAGAGAPRGSRRGPARDEPREGYFDQHLGSLDPSRTAVEEIRSVRGDLNVDGARQYLARFRFYGDDPLRKVSGFSGGERSRLALAKLLLEPRNLLFLDEPTNHLDIPAAEILEEALVGFEGTVILVSHDRRFLENVTTRTISIRDGVCDIYPGGFRDFVEAGRRVRAASEPPPDVRQRGKRSCRPTPPRPKTARGAPAGHVRAGESRSAGPGSARKSALRSWRTSSPAPRQRSRHCARHSKEDPGGKLGEDCESGARGASFEQANRSHDVRMDHARAKRVGRRAHESDRSVLFWRIA